MYIDFNYFNFNLNFISMYILTLITLTLNLYVASFTVALQVQNSIWTAGRYAHYDKPRNKALEICRSVFNVS